MVAYVKLQCSVLGLTFCNLFVLNACAMMCISSFKVASLTQLFGDAFVQRCLSNPHQALEPIRGIIFLRRALCT